MAKLKSPKDDERRPPARANLAGLSESMFREMMLTIRSYNDAAASSFIPGYYSANWTNDFLHSAGLITDQCYQDNRLWGDIFATAAATQGFIGSIFGGGGIAPTLRTKVIQTNEGKHSTETERTDRTGLGSLGLISDVETTVG